MLSNDWPIRSEDNVGHDLAGEIGRANLKSIYTDDEQKSVRSTRWALTAGSHPTIRWPLRWQARLTNCMSSRASASDFSFEAP